ncbi:MAG: hypothetical protein ACOZBX_09505 [Campylobacterota bacterium]
MKSIVFIALLLSGLFAQEAPLPPELKSWKSLAYVGAAKNGAELASAALELDRASLIGLHPTPKIHYVVRPMNEGGTVSYGGLFQIILKERGLYRVTLANASWIDLVKDGKSAQSVAHAQGSEKSGIRKMVDYNLDEGTYTLQLSAGADTKSAVLVTKLK